MLKSGILRIRHIRLNVKRFDMLVISGSFVVK